MEEKLLDEKRAFERQDKEDREEEARLRAEWEEVQEREGGLRRVPEEKKRSRVGESTIVGGVSCFYTDTTDEDGKQADFLSVGDHCVTGYYAVLHRVSCLE